MVDSAASTLCSSFMAVTCYVYVKSSTLRLPGRKAKRETPGSGNVQGGRSSMTSPADSGNAPSIDGAALRSALDSNATLIRDSNDLEGSWFLVDKARVEKAMKAEAEATAAEDWILV